MAAASRFVTEKLGGYFARKPKSKAERYGLQGGVPVVDRPHVPVSSEPQHPEDEHLFRLEDHGPLPTRGPPDELGPLPISLPGVPLIESVASTIDMVPGVIEIKLLIKDVVSLASGENERLLISVRNLESDYKGLLAHVEGLNSKSPELNEALTRLRRELLDTLSYLRTQTRKNQLSRALRRRDLTERIVRCEEAYQRIALGIGLIQGNEALREARQRNTQNSNATILNEELQASEEEIQQILRREIGRNVPREIILQAQIRVRELPAICTSRRFSVYRGEMMSGDKIAIKFSEVKHSLDDDNGRNFGRRTLRHASTWASFDSKYILPFLGMGVEITKRSEGGGRDQYKVYFVSPWISNGNAINYIRESHNQRLHVDVAKIVRDIALGLQYLHQREEPCIHGSVRGENVLIKMDNGVEQACLNGFALTKRQGRDAPPEMTGEDGIHRWKAPEILDYPGANPIMEPSSDIWSWAMTALELYSGKEPHYHRVKDDKVIGDIIKGTTPVRSQYPDFEKYAPQPNATWALFEKCWKKEPAERPTIQEVLDEIDAINAMEGSA